MLSRIVTLCLVFLLYLPSTGYSWDITTAHLTGNGWNDRSDESKEDYVVGVIDGMSFAFGKKKFNWLNDCTKGMKSGQLVAVVNLYHKEHPEVWHIPMNVLINKSIVAICPMGR